MDLASPTTPELIYAGEAEAGKRFRDRFPQIDGKRVLEIGCGFGGMLGELELSAEQIEGVDIDPERIAYATRMGHNATCGDACALAYPDATFDAIVSDATIEHLPDIDEAMAEMHRVLVPGGMVYAQWGPSWWTYNGPHLIKVLAIPWIHVVFSDRTILDALRIVRARGDAPRSYVEYKLSDFQSMGRVSRRKFRAACRQAGFVIRTETSESAREWKSRLSRLPGLDEALAGGLLAVLEKPAS